MSMRNAKEGEGVCVQGIWPPPPPPLLEKSLFTSNTNFSKYSGLETQMVH